MENLLKNTNLVNIAELERVCGFSKGRIAEVRRGRVKLTDEEWKKIRTVLSILESVQYGSDMWVVCCNDFPEGLIKGGEKVAEKIRLKMSEEDFNKNGSIQKWTKHLIPVV